MIWNGSRLSGSAYSRSSRRVAARLKMEKLTPPGSTVAPAGKRDPGRIAYPAGRASVKRDPHRSHIPDLIRVFAHRPVGRKLAGAGGVEDRHACPALLIFPSRFDPFLACDILGEVGEHEERIRVQQVLSERPEHLAVSVREMPVR